MANAAIAGKNLAATGTIGATSQELLLPIANLLTPTIKERWRSTSNTAAFIKPITGTFNSVVVRGLTCGPNSTARVRVSSVDSTGLTGDVVDSGVLLSGSQHFVSGVDSDGELDLGSVVYLLAAPQEDGYVRVDLYDPGSNYVEAGYLFVASYTNFTYNFAPGTGPRWVDRSRIAETSDGGSATWNQDSYRVCDLNFEWVTSSQRYGVLDTIDRVNGRHRNVMMILDTASTNLPRDTIIGLITEISPAIYNAAPELFSRQYSIKERL